MKTTLHQIREGAFNQRISGILLKLFLMVIVTLTGPVQAGNVTLWGEDIVSPPTGWNATFRKIAAGNFHNLALTPGGEVVAWGENHMNSATVPEGLYGVTDISAGYGRSLALKADGTVVQWGYNSGIDVPFGLDGVVAVSAGVGHNLALKSDGTVIAWGYDWRGECQVPSGLSGVVAIAAGGYQSLALKSDGTVVGWGGYDGPLPIPNGLSGVIAIAAGGSHCLAIVREQGYNDRGRVVAWGANNYGESSVPLVGPYPGRPMQAIAIAAGDAHSLALLPDGTVRAWGDNSHGQCNVPAGLNNVVAISVGTHHSLALKADGTIVAWGANYCGQSIVPSALNGAIAVATHVTHSLVVLETGTVLAFGENPYGECSVPGDLSDVVAVAAGESHSLALKANGSVASWGCFDQASVPEGLSSVVAIAAGKWHSLGLKQDGTVVAWGDNRQGQGNIPDGLRDVVAIGGGEWHSVALKSDGTVVTWGNNEHGQTQVPAGLSGVVAIAVGNFHNLAIKADGTVVGWGYNFYGQATPPAGLRGVVAVAAGLNHSLALKSDGSIVGWGNNNENQLTVPAGLTGVTSLVAGGAHSLALSKGGTTAENHSPIARFAIPNQVATCGTPFSYTFPADTFEDPDPGQTLTYAVSGLPPGLLFESSSRSFSGTPSVAGNYTVTVIAWDSGFPPLSASTTFQFTCNPSQADLPHIVNVNPRFDILGPPEYGYNPVVVPLPAGSYTVRPIGPEQGGQYVAWSPVGGGMWLWGCNISAGSWTEAVVLGSGVNTYSSPEQALAAVAGQSCTFTFAQPGNLYFGLNDTFYADNVGGVSMLIESLGSNHAPFVNAPILGQVGTCGTPFSYTFPADTFEDPDPGQTLTYAASGLPPGLLFESSSRSFSGTPSVAGNYTVTVIAWDNGSPHLSANATFRFICNPSQEGTSPQVLKLPGLVAYWSGDGDANDSVGQNNGVLQNGARADSEGCLGQAFLLDGDDDQIETPWGPTLVDQHGVTVMAWVRTSGSGDYSGIVSCRESTFAFHWFQLGLHTGGYVRADFGRDNPVGPYIVARSSQTIFDGQWHFLAGTYDGHTAVLYIDGLAAGSKTGEGYWGFDQPSFILIGNDPCYPGRNFNGQIDEAAVYNRPLSAQEICAIYAAESGKQCPAGANHAPSVSAAIPDQPGTYGSAFSYTFPADTFTDPDPGQSLSYTATGMPPGIGFDGATRTFSGTPTVVGAHTVKVTATDSGSPPAGADVSFRLIISPAPLTITANSLSKSYGELLTFAGTEFTVAGLVNNDVVNRVALTSAGALATATVANSPYTIVPGGAVGTGLDNYTITCVNGSLTVNPVRLTVAADNQSKVYGSTLPTLTASYSGIVNGDTAANLTMAVNLGTPANSSSPVGGYPIIPSGCSSPNYSIEFINGTLRIDPAELTISANDITSVYGAPLPVLTASYNGFVAGDGPTCLSTPPNLSTMANATSLVGNYEISVSGAANANYRITYVPGTLAVTPAPLVATVDSPATDYVQPVNAPLHFSGEFKASGIPPYTAKWILSGAYATDVSVPGMINQDATVTADVTLPAPGVYTVTLTLTDGAGTCAQCNLPGYVVIYAPDGGFVTGGGWLISPPGSYTLDPTLAGRASFGFLSKYEKAATVPTGSTEFKFHMANMEFRSTAYQWLVVAGAKAQYKGTGTINAGGNYGFMLTVIDGSVSGGGATDRLRMKIWDKNAKDKVVYDNLLSASDDAEPTTTIQGSIVIHK